MRWLATVEMGIGVEAETIEQAWRLLEERLNPDGEHSLGRVVGMVEQAS